MYVCDRRWYGRERARAWWRWRAPPAAAGAGAYGRWDAHVLKLSNHLLGRLLLEDRRCHDSHVRQELVVVGFLEVHLDVLERLALREVVVVRVLKEARPHAPDQCFRETVLHIEGRHAPSRGLR